MSIPREALALAHWRHTVAELYAAVRAGSERDAAGTAEAFRRSRDRLFREHAQSPIPASRRPGWRGAEWYPYDSRWRVRGAFEPAAAPATFDIELASDGTLRCAEAGTVRFTFDGTRARLTVYWLCGYGGGLWLPFTDATSGVSTYAGGRYLYDTIKGADLGAKGRELVLDFNYAYNPSCAYDDSWSCPLSPPENRLAFAVAAGERSPA